MDITDFPYGGPMWWIFLKNSSSNFTGQSVKQLEIH